MEQRRRQVQHEKEEEEKRKKFQAYGEHYRANPTFPSLYQPVQPTMENWERPRPSLLYYETPLCHLYSY
jgi:hypothetical protein